MSKVLVDRDRVVESMCLTWRHDFGLDKLEGCDFCSGMTDKERDHMRGQMGKLFDHHFAPALSAVTAERDRLREALEDLLGCPADIVQATVPKAGIEAAPPYQVVLDVSVSLTRWNKAKAAMAAKEA